MTRIRWIVTGVAVFTIGVVIVLAASLGSNKSEARNGTLGHVAPAFDLPALRGPNVSLAAWRGKVVVVNFWNDWCIPCQHETADLKRLTAARAGDGQFAFVGIVHAAHARKDIESYVRAESISYPVAFDPGARTALDYAVTGQPETFVIDKHGVVRNWISGPIELGALQSLIDSYEQETA